MGNNGRPEYTDEQYREWLNEMAPFLKMGYSLHQAINKTILIRHKDSIYRKYRLNDWFCEKTKAFQNYPGETTNNIFTKFVMIANEKVRNGQQLSSGEWRNLRFFAEKHRSCQPFFIRRHEVAQAKDNRIGNILDALELPITD